MKNLSAIIFLFIANSISGIAQGISMIAIPWYFTMRDEMGSFGLIYIVTNAIGLLWVPYSGTFVDKYNRRNIFLVITTVSGLLLTWMAYQGYQHGGLSSWLVGFVFMFTFFNYNIHYPNLYAFVQEIVEPERYGSISSYIEIQGQSTNILAGATAAILLEGSETGVLNILGFDVETGWRFAPWQIHEIFALDATTYFVGFIFISLIRYVPLTEREHEPGPINQRLKAGLNYLIKHTRILVFGIASHSVFAAAIVTSMFLAPIYVKNNLLEEGAIYASGKMYFAMGSVIAGIAIRRIFSQVNIPVSVMMLTGLAGLGYLVLSLNDYKIVFFIASFFIGLSNAGIRVQRVTYLFMVVPNQVYGRAMSIFTQVNTLERILFLLLFSMAFFQESDAIVYAYGILSVFLILSLAVLSWNYRKLELKA